jgi:hypothetical protein
MKWVLLDVEKGHEVGSGVPNRPESEKDWPPHTFSATGEGREGNFELRKRFNSQMSLALDVVPVGHPLLNSSIV